MFYDGGIDFLADSFLKVPKDLSFYSDQAINIAVRRFKSCYMDQKDKNSMILADTGKVGCVFFDMDSTAMAAKNKFQNCVVVGMSADDLKEDPDKEYYILVVRETSEKGKYERLGVGQVQARFVSKRSSAGKLL
jgi:hypothetical protein